jgi:hypothetical protein
MSIKLFKHIATEAMKFDPFFEHQRNAAGELGHSTYQKVTAALRMLAYGILADLIDDNLAMGERTDIMCVKRTTSLLEFNADRGFLGMLGSIDCMH